MKENFEDKFKSKEKQQDRLKESSAQIIPGDKKSTGGDFEIVKGEQLNKVITSITEIKDKIDHDQLITEKNILELKENINNLPINIGGEGIPTKEIKKTEERKRSLEIFKEIEAGNFDNCNKLTFITVKIAKILSGYKGRLDFNKLESLSDDVAEILSNHEGSLSFRNITLLSDNAAESLIKHKGFLSFDRLKSFSENVAKSFSKHKNLYVPTDSYINSKFSSTTWETRDAS